MTSRWLWACLLTSMVTGCVDRLIVDDAFADGENAGGDAGLDGDAATWTVPPDEPEGTTTSPLPPPPEPPPLPPPVELGVIYGNTAYELFRIDLAAASVQSIGTFDGDAGSGSITDIAVDDDGVLYAVSSSGLYVCDPFTVWCDQIADLDGGNAAAFVPDPAGGASSLYVAGGGNVSLVVPDGQTTGLLALGSYASSTWGRARSDGDLVAVVESDGTVGLYATVDFDGYLGALQRLEGLSPGALVDPGVAIGNGLPDLWGLASLDGKLYALSPTGDILDSTGVVMSTPHAWWGAASHPQSR